MHWRATAGAWREVFFTQKHMPGQLSAFDLMHMEELGVTIEARRFDHLIYHFVLTYSDWEAVWLSESFESLSEGLQNPLWELGRVGEPDCTVRLSTAVNNAVRPADFARCFEALSALLRSRREKIRPVAATKTTVLNSGAPVQTGR